MAVREQIYFLITKGISRVSLHGGIRIRHHEKTGAQAIYVANHPSTLDPVFVMSSLPQPVSMLISHFIFQIPVVGFLLSRAGHVKVTEGRGRDAYSHSLDILRQGGSLLIFPEGRVSTDKHHVGPLFTGAVRLAMETQTPIVPIGIYLDPGRIKKHAIFFGEKKEEGNWYSNGVYGITYGKPVPFTGEVNERERVTANTEELRRVMDRQIQETADYIRNHELHRKPHFNLLSIIVYLFRLHFAYTNWINS